MVGNGSRVTWRIRGAGRPRARWVVLVAGLLVGVGLIGARSFQLQVLESEHWQARALEQQRQRLSIPAPRGGIYDRNGIPLVTSREVFRVAVAPRELEDAGEAARLLESVLGLKAAEARGAVGRHRRWVVLPGRYGPALRDRLAGVRGFYFERVLERSYPHGDLALELLGRVSADDRALGGLELEFDSLLAGRPGLAVVRRDARGRPIPGGVVLVAKPVPGHDLHLSLDVHLQEIAHDALKQAIARTGAAGGDLVFADPRTGEILAAASRRRSGMRRWTSVTDPYEPGSTFKPFLLAALLAEGQATLSDTVDAEGGRYVRRGRTIADVGSHGRISVRDALRVSSNVAMVKLAEGLDPAVQYRYLRDFGFGTPTRIPYPSEASGLLRRPSQWTGYSQASLAMGYEISVTPLQITLAYGALANGGVLMEPRLVREVRSPSGATVARYAPRAVRQVVPTAIAAELAEVLGEAVEAGTGQQAALGVFRVAGKTGTARQVAHGNYEAGSYTASFAGFFPVVDPQLVFVVKLDRPRGEYYGGRTAAPVTRAMLTAALAARSTPLDRRAVYAAAVEAKAANGTMAGLVLGDRPRGGGTGIGGGAAGDAVAVGDLVTRPRPIVLALNGGKRLVEGNGRVALRLVPDVRGLSVREAALRLHSMGFAVQVEGTGRVDGLDPAPGLDAPERSVVTIHAREGRQ